MLWLLIYPCAIAGDLQAALAVVPGIVYRDHVLVHYRDTKQKKKPYLLVIQRIGNRAIIITVKNAVSGPNDFGSIFIRGRVLIAASYLRAFGDAIDEVEYVSAERVCEGKWAFVHPNGELVKFPPDEKHAIMWKRRIELLLDDDLPGVPYYVHTAVAPDGKRDLLAFDLIVTNPEEGKPTPPPKIAVSRIVPEERARSGAGAFAANVGEPDFRHAENIEARFEVPFQAYVIGDDYYFVTKTGEVYIAVPAKKGKDRVTVKWDATMPRVAYVISEGERSGVHFLITARDKTGWHYYHLGPEPKPLLLSEEKPYPADKEPVEVRRTGGVAEKPRRKSAPR